MASKRIPTETIGSVLEHSLKRLDLAARLDDYAIWPIWNDVVGKAIARNAQPEKIRNGTLLVKVSSPVWMQQLQFMKEMIAGKLNQRLNAERVKTIFFMVGTVETPEESPGEPSAATNEAPPNEDFLDSVADPEMRALFRRLLHSYARRKTKI
jgi:predicted nucleic acid-binding Zn ribbon protein